MSNTKPQAVRLSFMAACLVLLAAPHAHAQRADDNAVTAADDAFGTSVGRETVGIYSSSSVRGFSPSTAGNVRIDGLYFDQVWGVNERLRSATSVRVGLSSLGFPFTSPTGVIDNVLRRPGANKRASFYSAIDSYGGASIEGEATIPLSKTLSITAGLAGGSREFENGTNYLQHVEHLIARWRPSGQVDIMPFWIRSDVYDDEIGPIYSPAGNFAPRTPRRTNVGPDWATYEGTAINYGVLTDVSWSEDWTLRAGLFRSIYDDKQDFANLMLGVEPNGDAEKHLLIVDPPSKIGSTSGELRSTYRMRAGDVTHFVHGSLRARDRNGRTGGSAVIDLGPTNIFGNSNVTQPDFTFGEQTLDRVQQVTGGLAYEARWRGVGELTLSLQNTDYRKRIDIPSAPLAETKASPWLYSGAVAFDVFKGVVAYAGYARGLEESGIAPDNASNRNEALPAILTEQVDAGLRWTITPTLKVVAGVFEISKPYFSLDENARFDLLGDVRHRGVELSMSGSPMEGVSLLAGAVLLDPAVTGEGVELGRVGPRPVGLADTTVILNLDWRPPAFDQLSFDIGVTYESERPGTRDNGLLLPARTRVDLGGRYRFDLAGNAATLRLIVTNALDEDSLDLRGAGSFDAAIGRLATLSLAAEF